MRSLYHRLKLLVVWGPKFLTEELWNFIYWGHGPSGLSINTLLKTVGFHQADHWFQIWKSSGPCTVESKYLNLVIIDISEDRVNHITTKHD